MPTILLPIDFTIRSDRALRRAIMLAKSSGSSLSLLHVVENPLTPDPIPVGGAPPPGIDELRRRLDRIADGIVEFDRIECRSRVRTGQPVEQIALECEDVQASLIVIAPHRRRLTDLVVDSTAVSLAKKGAVPVLIANDLPAGGYRRILVPTGLEAASAEIMRSIGELPLGGPHEVFAVYVWEPLRFAASADHRRHLRDETRAADTDLSDFLQTNGLGECVQSQVRLNRSTFAREIEECASELLCDAIAIGASEKSFFEKMIVGSVAEAVVRDVNADIILFP